MKKRNKESLNNRRVPAVRGSETRGRGWGGRLRKVGRLGRGGEETQDMASKGARGREERGRKRVQGEINRK